MCSAKSRGKHYGAQFAKVCTRSLIRRSQEFWSQFWPG